MNKSNIFLIVTALILYQDAYAAFSMNRAPSLSSQKSRKNTIVNNYDMIAAALKDPAYQSSLKQMSLYSITKDFENQLKKVEDIIIEAQPDPFDQTILRKLNSSINQLETSYSVIEGYKRDLDRKLSH